MIFNSKTKILLSFFVFLFVFFITYTILIIVHPPVYQSRNKTSVTTLITTKKNTHSHIRFAAFIRFKNEIKTLPAMLESIDGVFDKIVMIHSNEKDDGSIAYAQKWCQKHPECLIRTYPHAVIPSNDPRYTKRQVKSENTLSAYYNFGLSFFEPSEFVVKIDADQVYLTHKLKETLDFIRNDSQLNPNKRYGIRGYNSYTIENNIFLFKPHPRNGGIDSFIIKREHIIGFKQKRWYETLQVQPQVTLSILKGEHWFHFMQALRSRGKIRQTSAALPSERALFSIKEQQLFNHYIRPLLTKTGSSYQNILF